MGANFTPKQWKNLPDTSTIVNAAALIDLENRVTDYADLVVANPSIDGGNPSTTYLTIQIIDGGTP